VHRLGARAGREDSWFVGLVATNRRPVGAGPRVLARGVLVE
jgi:hypothetical protein